MKISVLTLVLASCAASSLALPAEPSPREETTGGPVGREMDDATKAFVARLAKSESVYDDIDVTWSTQYKLENPSHKRDETVWESSTRTHYVRQGDRYFLDYSTHIRNGKAATDRSRVKAYDGDRTLLLGRRGATLGTIIYGYQDDLEKFLPHMLPLRYKDVVVPLSIWLQGDDAIQKYPGGRLDKRNVHLASHVGTQVVDGLLCDKVQTDYFLRLKPISPIGRDILWLATDRNHLPVRLDHYTLNISSLEPVSETRMTDLREIAPGVWFPFGLSETKYDSPALATADRRQIAWTRETKIEAVGIAPKHETEFFQAIVFPEGTKISERSADGKLIPDIRIESPKSK